MTTNLHREYRGLQPNAVLPNLVHFNQTLSRSPIRLHKNALKLFSLLVKPLSPHTILQPRAHSANNSEPMAPLKPHWTQPSHPDLLQVIVSEGDFRSKSVSTATAAPFAVVAKLSFPPCALADEPTYATVQIGRNRHLNLNSDLLYLNHSCEPSLVSPSPLRKQPWGVGRAQPLREGCVGDGGGSDYA